MRYRKGYKYQLAEDYEVYTSLYVPVFKEFDGPVQIYPGGLMRLDKGYAWDGPSGPAVDTPTFMRASLGHDGLYQLMRHGILPQSYRKEVDRLMSAHCLEDGMNRFRAWYAYTGVRVGAGPAASPDAIRKIYTAP